jgi:6-phosphogluconolactonase
MTLWNVYVGTLTKEFATEIGALRAGRSDPWRGNARNLGMQQDGFPQGGRFASGIERFRFDDVDGTLSYADTVADGLVNPQYLALHPTLPVVYAAEWARPSRLSAFAVRGDGSLERLSTTDSRGELAVAAAVHPSGQVAYVAHWGDGALSALALDEDGRVRSAEVVVPGDPRGIADRAHHHQVLVTPGGTGVLVTDVGNDELLAYRADADGTLSPQAIARVEFPANSGPRHLEFHPSGRFVYVLGEWDSMLHVVEAEDGIPIRIVDSISTVPPGFDGTEKTSEIHLHPDGRTLFVGNRKSNCITVFSVDDAGKVEVVGHEPTLGHGPAAVRVDPAGRHLLAGNVYSGSFVVFRIDDDRRLHLVGDPVEARAPRSFVFQQASD